MRAVVNSADSCALGALPLDFRNINYRLKYYLCTLYLMLAFIMFVMLKVAVSSCWEKDSYYLRLLKV